MRDEVDWSLTTWSGSRRQQHRDFLALSFREKIEIIEQLSDVGRFFIERRRARGLPVIERTGEGKAPP